MADERQKVADGEKLIYFVLFLMLQQRLLREPIQIVTIVVIGYLIFEWTYPNGKKPAYLSPFPFTPLTNTPYLHVIHWEMWVFCNVHNHAF